MPVPNWLPHSAVENLPPFACYVSDTRLDAHIPNTTLALGAFPTNVRMPEERAIILGALEQGSKVAAIIGVTRNGYTRREYVESGPLPTPLPDMLHHVKVINNTTGALSDYFVVF